MKINKWMYIPLAIASIGILAGSVRLWNNYVNNRREDHGSYFLVSVAEGLEAHTECIINRVNNTIELKKYDEWHNLKTYHADILKESKVQTIQEERNMFYLNGLETLLIRAKDYETNKEKFDEADNEILDFVANTVYK